MKKLDISRSLLNFNGGLLGRAMIAKAGFVDAFTVNNKFSVLVSEDHFSVKAMENEKPTKNICRQIAISELGYKDFTIKKDGNCLYVYNNEVKNEDESKIFNPVQGDKIQAHRSC